MRIVAFAIAAWLGLSALSGARSEVTIANIAPWSSSRPYSALGTLRGTELAIEAVNAAGGLLGQKLRNVQIDDGCNPEQGRAAAALAVASRPVLVMGAACSTAAIEIAQTLARNGILQIIPNAAPHKVMEVGIPTILRMAGRGTNEGTFIAALLARHWPQSRIAVADDGTANWQEATAGVLAGLAKSGLAATLETRFEPNQKSFDGFVRQLEEARIDVLYANGVVPDLGVLVRDIRASNPAMRLVFGRNVSSDIFLQTAGRAAEGVVFPNRRDWREAALADRVLATEKASGGEINVFVVSAYIAMQVWIESVIVANSFDAVAVATTAKGRSFSTVFGDLEFDDQGDLTPESEQWAWFRWHAGEIVPAPDME